MLKFSTNITAEGVGLTATRAENGTPPDLERSAAQMSDWAAQKAGLTADFKDHSGLSDATRISARDMVALLQTPSAADALRPLLKDIVLTDEDGKAIAGFPAEVRAKTGTLNFVSALAGYIRTEAGDDLAFAIFTANSAARQAGIASGDEQPAGSQYWNGRSRRLQQRLLQRWSRVYTTAT